VGIIRDHLARPWRSTTAQSGTKSPTRNAGCPPPRFLSSRADRLLADHPMDLDSYDLYVAARAGLAEAALDGDTLLHADFHAGNLLVGRDQLYLIDRGLACRGEAWVETALLIPRLITGGHTLEQAEALAAQVPAFKAAPQEAVSGLAAVWSLFREFVARYGPEHNPASLAAAAAAGRAWVVHRMR
jgi:Ser/Thr protein kinase RdoA (MazF antagonist)